MLALMAACTNAGAAPKRDDKVFAAAQAGRDGAIALLKQIVNIDSGTGDVAGGNKVAAVLAARLKALGGEVRVEKCGKARLCRQSGGGVSRHRQGAHPDRRPYRHRVRPGHGGEAAFHHHWRTQAHGPGVLDCKSGVAGAFTALKILRDLNYRNYATITLILDGSEEQGSPGSTQLIKTAGGAA